MALFDQISGSLAAAGGYGGAAAMPAFSPVPTPAKRPSRPSRPVAAPAPSDPQSDARRKVKRPDSSRFVLIAGDADRAPADAQNPAPVKATTAAVAATLEPANEATTESAAPAHDRDADITSAGPALAALPTPPWIAWSETAFLTAAFPALGFFTHAQDPLYLHTSFAWPLLAPLLLGLRYGFKNAVASALALVAAITLFWHDGGVHAGYPAQASVGILVTGMLAGVFRNRWSRRLTRALRSDDHHKQRLAVFTRAWHLLQHSHDRLEQRLAGTTRSLHGALADLRQEFLAANPAEPPFFGLGDRILSVFASFGSVQLATLHPVTRDGVILPAAAHLGQLASPSPDDLLLSEALRSKAVASVRDLDHSGAPDTDLLCAIPLCDVRGRVRGIVAVRDMIFIAFNDETLRALAVLGGHVGDLLAEIAGPKR